MPTDLEEFLRRAAQRRQAKAVEYREAQQAAAPKSRARSQYSDRHTERLPRDLAADAVINSADDLVTAKLADDDSRGAPAKRLDKENRSTSDAKRGAPKSLELVDQRQALPMNPTLESLLAALREPGGIQQAILMREILDRPESRWD